MLQTIVALRSKDSFGESSNLWLGDNGGPEKQDAFKGISGSPIGRL